MPRNLDRIDLIGGLVIVLLVLAAVGLFLNPHILKGKKETQPLMICTHVNDGYFWCENGEERRYMYVENYE